MILNDMCVVFTYGFTNKGVLFLKKLCLKMQNGSHIISILRLALKAVGYITYNSSNIS